MSLEIFNKPGRQVRPETPAARAPPGRRQGVPEEMQEEIDVQARKLKDDQEDLREKLKSSGLRVSVR